MDWEDFTKNIKKLELKAKLEIAQKKQINLVRHTKINDKITVSNLENLIKSRHNFSEIIGKLEFSSSNYSSSSSIDKKHKKIIKKQGVNAKLDLHGYKIAEAIEVFENFIQECYLENIRTALIITGKGCYLSENTIKKTLLYRLKNDYYGKIIQSFNISSMKDGGDGAIYIILRKIK